MWSFALFVLVLPALASGSFAKRNEDEGVQPMVKASPVSIPTPSSPGATVSADLDTLELRQVPTVVAGNVAKPSVGSSTSTMLVVVLTTTSVTSRSITATSTSSSLSTVTSSINTNYGQPLDYTTTKWVETWVGGTYSTWTPTVITVIHKTPAPAPPLWHGEIGMGSLTGETGITQTVFLGAAPSQAAGWARGIVAAVGVGFAGIVV
ncbi:hypothetical protein HBI76_073280 [Parastagonospora nodorum]|nr:hypothetical protein HBI76_073280 [Parastagonospora nodorum]